MSKLVLTFGEMLFDDLPSGRRPGGGPFNSSVPAADAIAFWMLGVRHPTSRGALKEVLAKAGTDTPRFVDLGIRKKYFNAGLIDWLLQEATVAKLNEEELQIICETLEMEASPQVLAKAYKLDTVVITLGPEGAYSWRNGAKTTAKSPKVDVVDTVGCGDAFLAGYIHHRLQGDDEQTCLEKACARGSYAAMQQGGLP